MIKLSTDLVEVKLNENSTPVKRKRRSNSSTPETANSKQKLEFKCPKCNYLVLSQKKLEKHLALPECGSKELQCEFCDKKFKDLKTLEHHRNLHLGIKPYKCEHCESYFGTKGEMNRHVKYKHTMEKPHKCTDCEYSTVELSKLKRHMRVHTDERPYLCHLCDYASRDTFRLKRHLRTHTGEKPYECPICQNRFSQSNGLKAHIKTFHDEVPIVLDENGAQVKNNKASKTPRRHRVEKSEICLNEAKPSLSSFILSNKDAITNPCDEFYTCEQCFMRFLTKDLLIEHTVKHTGERPFICDICGMNFSHKFALRAHLLSHDANYNEKLSQTLTTASQMTKNRFLHRKNKLQNIETEQHTEQTGADKLDNQADKDDENVEDEVKETLDSIVNRIEVTNIVQLVKLNPVPELIEHLN